MPTFPWSRRATVPAQETRPPLEESIREVEEVIRQDDLLEAQRQNSLDASRSTSPAILRTTYPMPDARTEYSLKQGGKDVAQRTRKISLYQAFLGESWVSACCEAIANRLISGGWTLRAVDPKRPNEKSKEPLLEYLNWCNQDESFPQILHDAATDLLWSGECYLEVTWKYSSVLKRTVPYELYTVDVISMDYVLDKNMRSIAGYMQSTDDGQAIALKPEQIVRIWFPDPRNRLRALSPIEKLLNPITLDTYIQLSERKYFEQGNRGDIHINLETGDEAQAGRLQTWITERFLGVKNAHKPLITFGSTMQVSTIGNRAALDVDSRRKLNRDEILSVYKVPPHMVSSMDNTGQGGQAVGDVMEKQFIHTAVDPIKQKLLDPINFRLGVQGFGIDDWVIDTSYADFRDTRDIARIQAERIRFGISSINEERIAMNRRPFKGGDVPVVMLGNQAIPVELLPELAKYLRSTGGMIAKPAGFGAGAPKGGSVGTKDEAPGDVRTGDRSNTEPTTERAPTYKYGSTQCNLPEPAASLVRAFAAAVPDAHLASDGRETMPHITVKYGLTDTGAAARETLRALCAGTAPLRVTLGAVSLFQTPDYDVVKLSVEGPALQMLHTQIETLLPYVTTFPLYIPHITIAYVRSGFGQVYDGLAPLAGMEIVLPALTLSDREGAMLTFPFAGQE